MRQSILGLLLGLNYFASGCATPDPRLDPEARAALLPAFATELHGAAEIQFENSQYFSVTAGIRASDGGANVDVPAGGRASLFVPPGKYDLHFVYANTPDHVRHDERARIVVEVGSPATIKLVTALPPCAVFLQSGGNLVTVHNSNEYSVEVALRTAAGGADLWVPAMGSASVRVPDGTYDVYFVFSAEPVSLYQGDAFRTAGHRTTIDLARAVGGNYGIRRVR